MPRKSILLLSAYDAPSHVYWREGLVANFPEYQWQVLTMPPRFFSWRARGNSLSWAFGEQREVLDRDYDLIVATSMVDLSALRGFVPRLACMPTLLYCHENQFAYPEGQKQRSSVDSQLTSLYSALCVDKVLFNSRYNLQTFCGGNRALLKKMPDLVPSGIADLVEEKSVVLPVPINDDLVSNNATSNKSLNVADKVIVLWNHRWEYDKGPDRLLLLVEKVIEQDLPVCFSVVGQQFRQQPPAFETIQRLLGDKGMLHRWGYQQADDYRKCLQESHVVLSTSLHEFQGLAVMEAAAAGCIPLVPDRLAYQEFYPETCRYASNLDEPEQEADGLVNKLAHYIEQPPDLEGLQLPLWSGMQTAYGEVFEALMAAKS